MGGRTTWENIVTCCLKCNARKADRLPHQANMRLLRKPERPRWRPFVSSMLGDRIDEGGLLYATPANIVSAIIFRISLLIVFLLGLNVPTCQWTEDRLFLRLPHQASTLMAFV